MDFVSFLKYSAYLLIPGRMLGEKKEIRDWESFKDLFKMFVIFLA